MLSYPRMPTRIIAVVAVVPGHATQKGMQQVKCGRVRTRPLGTLQFCERAHRLTRDSNSSRENTMRTNTKASADTEITFTLPGI